MNCGYFYCPYIPLDTPTRRDDRVENPTIEDAELTDAEFDEMAFEYYMSKNELELLPYDAKEGF